MSAAAILDWGLGLAQGALVLAMAQPSIKLPDRAGTVVVVADRSGVIGIERSDRNRLAQQRSNRHNAGACEGGGALLKSPILWANATSQLKRLPS